MAFAVEGGLCFFFFFSRKEAMQSVQALSLKRLKSLERKVYVTGLPCLISLSLDSVLPAEAAHPTAGRLLAFFWQQCQKLPMWRQCITHQLHSRGPVRGWDGQKSLAGCVFLSRVMDSL